MKAIVYTKYGSPDVLQLKEIDQPTPKANQILVRVGAATVSRTDCAVLSGKPLIMRLFIGLFAPSKKTTGTDFAGEVVAKGEQVQSFNVGDRVFGFDDKVLSSHAQYLVVAEDQAVIKMPQNFTFEQVAACIEGAHYAYNFIQKIKIEKGQKVLVNGATGAIGTAAVQLLKYLDTSVVAVANTKNIDLIKSLGADVVLDYQKEDFTKYDEKYDLIIDTVRSSSYTKCKALLHPNGKYMSSELGWMASNIFMALMSPLLGGKKVVFPIPTEVKKSLHFIKDLMEKGHFKAVIDRKYPLEEVAEAFAYVAKGHKTGSVVITTA